MDDEERQQKFELGDEELEEMLGLGDEELAAEELAAAEAVEMCKVAQLEKLFALPARDVADGRSAAADEAGEDGPGAHRPGACRPGQDGAPGGGAAP